MASVFTFQFSLDGEGKHGSCSIALGSFAHDNRVFWRVRTKEGEGNCKTERQDMGLYLLREKQLEIHCSC